MSLNDDVTRISKEYAALLPTVPSYLELEPVIWDILRRNQSGEFDDVLAVRLIYDLPLLDYSMTSPERDEAVAELFCRCWDKADKITKVMIASFLSFNSMPAARMLIARISTGWYPKEHADQKENYINERNALYLLSIDIDVCLDRITNQEISEILGNVSGCISRVLFGKKENIPNQEQRKSDCNRVISLLRDDLSIETTLQDRIINILFFWKESPYTYIRL